MIKPDKPLEYGTHVRSAADLNSPSRVVLESSHPKNLKARRPGTEGYVLSSTQDGDVYWIMHDTDLPAVYCFTEIELVDSPAEIYATKAADLRELFEGPHREDAAPRLEAGLAGKDGWVLCGVRRWGLGGIQPQRGSDGGCDPRGCVGGGEAHVDGARPGLVGGGVIVMRYLAFVVLLASCNGWDRITPSDSDPNPPIGTCPKDTVSINSGRLRDLRDGRGAEGLPGAVQRLHQ